MKKFAIILIIICLSLVVIDKGLKYFDRRKVGSKKDYVHQLRMESVDGSILHNYSTAGELELYPYMMFKARSNVKNATLSTNSFGLRAGDFKDKTPGTYRIIVVGGSTAFGGMATSDKKTFTYRLEEILNNPNSGFNRSFEVINAGVPSFNSMQELILIEMKLIELDPDMIIVVDGFNDALTYLKRDSRAGYPYLFKKLEKMTSTEAFLKERARKIRIIRKILEFFEKREALTKTTFDSEVVKFYENNLNNICHLLNSYGIKPFLVFQPILDYKNPLSENEKTALEHDTSMSRKLLVKLCDELQKKARNVALTNNALYLDSRTIYDGIPDTLFMDDCHLNDKAQAILAEELYRRVSSFLKSTN